jgi:hypothetical protein
MRLRLRYAALTCAAFALSPGCSSTPAPPTPTTALWVVPDSLDELSDVHFYDHPWPSDYRRNPDGTIAMQGFYNPMLVPLITNYIEQTKGLIDGFSPVASAYFRFTADIDPTTLPVDPPSTLIPYANVQIIDIDPGSPERGQRHLAETYWQQADGVYWLHDTLAVRPAYGYPLRPHTRYAIIVTNGLLGANQLSVAPSDDLREVLDEAPLEPRVQAVHDLYAPAIEELARAGVPVAWISHLSVFTTDDPTSDLFLAADSVHANFPAPAADPTMWAAKEQTPDYDVYEGWYGPSPNFQAGTPPYLDPSQGGGLVHDATGTPVVQNTFSLRFALVIPKAAACPMPPDGYPIVLYAHGTGGDYRSIVDETNSFGEVLATQCLASMGIDQIFHGVRPGAPPLDDPMHEIDVEVRVYNVQNPVAARYVEVQGAIDVVQQARLFTESHTAVPAQVSRTGASIKLDAGRLLFLGHSQGGTNGPLFLAADGQARGGVLSGSSAMFLLALLEKTNPSPNISEFVKLLIGLTTADDQVELDPTLPGSSFHPVLNLAQTIADPTDPVHYERFIIQEPRPGFAHKSILQTEGVDATGAGDTYAPPRTIEIASVALGLPRETPGIFTIVQASWGGLMDVTVPPGGLQGNLAGGAASGVLGQFLPAPNDDGHFVAFDVPAAHHQVAQFCRNLADDPRGRVPPLMP